MRERKGREEKGARDMARCVSCLQIPRLQVKARHIKCMYLIPAPLEENRKQRGESTEASVNKRDPVSNKVEVKS